MPPLNRQRRVAGKPTRKRTTAKQLRRRAMPKLTRRLVGVGLPALAVAAALGIGSWAVASGTAGKAVSALGAEIVSATGRLGLQVRDVLVSGRERVGREELQAALGARPGMPILQFDPHAAKTRIESLAWVRSAAVERRLPDTVYVSMTEREPLALWQREGRITLIDRDGTEIRTEDPGQYRHLPLVVGSGAAGQARTILSLMNGYPRLSEKMTSLVRIGDRRWDIRFEGGVIARLPELGPQQALARLARLDIQDRVLDRAVVVIDLRLPDRLVVQTLPKDEGGRPAPKPRPTPARDA